MYVGFKQANRWLLAVSVILALCLMLFQLKPTKVLAGAGINQTINFQGRLLNSQGAIVPDGFYNIEFKIYQDGDGQSAGDTTGSPAGSLKWTEDYLAHNSQGVKVVNGYLSVNLGSITAFGSNIDWNQSVLWLSMNIAGTSSSCTTFAGCSPDGEMTPMQPLTSAPYALNAGELGGIGSANFLQIAQGIQTDATNSTSLALNKTGSGNIVELQSSGSDAFLITNSGDETFGANANHTISVATTASTAGKNLSINAGAAGSGGSALTGGTLALNGGAGGGTNGNGGNVTLDPGAPNGSGSFGTVTIGGNNQTSQISLKVTSGGNSTTLSFSSPAAAGKTVTIPNETGTLCTNASTSACNTAGALTNVAYLNATTQTFTGQNTFSKTGSGSNDYTLGITSTPAASSTSSLVRIGNVISSGNGNTNGGTYLNITEPTSGAGSAADFLNLQNGSTVELLLNSGGDLTVNGHYNTNTFTSTSLAFGGNSAASVTSNGSNNLTVDTGSSGGTETIGANAATTNIANTNAAHTIAIGSGGTSTAQAVTIGSAGNTTSTLTLQGGNGSNALILQTGNNGTTTAGTITIGNTSGAFNQTIAIGTNANANNIINLGTGTAQDSVTVGDNTNANSSVNIKAGSTGGITFSANTSLSANSNFTYASGTGKFDASNASGSFDTTTGTNQLNGNTTVTGTKTFTVNGGLTTLKAGVSVQTGSASSVGAILQGAASQSASLLQIQDSTGANLLGVDSVGDQDISSGYFNTAYGGLGSFGNLLEYSEQFQQGVWTPTNITVTANDGATNPAPDGNPTADKLVSSTTQPHTITQTYSSAGNHTYTFSVWVKTTSTQAGQLRIDSNGTPGTGTAVSFTATTTWQRLSVTQTFSGSTTTVTPTLIMTNNSADMEVWGAQLVQAATAETYIRSLGSVEPASSGLIDNDFAIFLPSSNSATAFQVEDASGTGYLTGDSTNDQLILGQVGTLSGKLALATAGGGTITLSPASTASNFTITVPAETGQICTTAASAACTAVYAAASAGGYVNFAPSSVQADGSNNNSIFINKTSGTGNILELQKSGSDVFVLDNTGNVTSTGQNTLSRNGVGANDYTFAITGTTSATGSSSLVRIGNALTGGNGAANGGTYLSIVEPNAGLGSAADFLNFQNVSGTIFQLTAGGSLTVGGSQLINTNTFNGNTLTFGTNGAATITSNGSNNLTVDTGSSGGTETIGANAATTNIANTNAAHTIAIGSGGTSTAQAVTIGSAGTTASTLTLQGGNGSSAIVLQTGNNGTTTAGTITVGNTTGAFSQSINIGTNNTAGANNIVHIADAGTAQDNVTIGSTGNVSNAVNINAGSTGGITLGANTSLSANSNFTYASGSGNFDAHNSTGTFDSTSGTNQLNGNTTVTGTKTFTVNGGLTTLKAGLNVQTGAAGTVGTIIQGANSQTAQLLQLQNATTANLLTIDATGDQDISSGYLNTAYGGFGSYGNLLKYSEQFDNGVWSPTHITVTANDAGTNPAPDGTTTADKLVSNTTQSHTITQTCTTGCTTNSVTYTFSVWVKTTTTQAGQLRIDWNNGSNQTGTASSFTAQTTWQRISVSQAVSTSGMVSVTPTLIMTNNSADMEVWGAQLVQASIAEVYVRSLGATVPSSDGLINNGNAIFQNSANSTLAYQFQNASGVNVAAFDTSNGQEVLGTSGASGLTGQLTFNFSGQTGSIALVPLNPSSTAYTINLPAESGTLCTTASSGVCSTAGSGYVQLAPTAVQADGTNNNSIFINKTSGTGNILELQKSAGDVFKVDNSGNVTSTGQNTLSRNSSGANDYTFGVTGTTSATGSSSLVRIGGPFTGGNGAANGGTYVSIVEPSSGAGSAADFLNFQNGSTVELQLTAGGSLTVGGSQLINTNTFNGNTLTFGTNGAATISSNGSNNITVDTGSAGGTETLGNNAATTNIGTSNAAHTIGIGTGASGTTTQAITIGEATNSSSTLTLQGGNGTGAITLQTGNNGTTTAGTIQIGNTSGAFNQTISIGNNNSANNTVQIGTGTGQDSVTIGNTNNVSSIVNINAGSTGGINLGASTLLTANNNFVMSAGTGKFDAHSASGTFDTSSGANSLNGNTTVTGTNSFTVNAGPTTLNGLAAGSSTALKVTTNAASNVGLLLQGAASQTANLEQFQDSTSANLFTFDALGDSEQLGNLDTPFGGLGSYGNLLQYSEQLDNNGPWTRSNLTSVTANDGPSNPSPNNTTTAEKIVSSGSGTHSLAQTCTTGCTTNSVTYAFSVWVKTNSSSTGIQLRIDWNNGSGQTGTASSFTATTTWQRFFVTQAVSASGMVSVTPTLIITSNNATIVGWGAQLVQASTPGVYTPTTSSQVSATEGLTVDGNGLITGTLSVPTVDVASSGTLSLGTSVATGVTLGGTSNTTAINLQGTAGLAVNIGNAAGSGVLTNNGATVNTTLALTDFATGGSIGTAAATVDKYTSISVAQTTAGQTLTIPNPLASTTYGRTLYLSNIGTASFILSGVRVPPGDTATLMWSNTNGAASWQFAGAGASSIENQNTADQTADFRINGTGRAATSFVSPLFDAISGGLSLGTSTATSVTVGGTSNTTTITLQGAGGLAINLGNAAGAGVVTNNGATVNTVLAVSNLATGGNIGTAANTVDKYTSFSVNQTTTGQTVTIPSPTAATTYGRTIYVSNIGTASFILGGVRVPPGDTATLVWSNTNGGASWQFAGAGASSIENQNTADQTADFRITGSGQANTSFLTPLLDTPSGTTTLNIGTTNATAGISLNQNTTVLSGKTFTVTGGATSLTGNSGGSTTAVAISTGAASNIGMTIQGASSQTASLLKLQDSTTANLLTVDAAGNMESIGYIDTPYGGFGNYGNLLTYSEQLDNAAWTASNITVTANDAGSNPAPDGNTTAEKLVSAASGSPTIKQTCTTGCTTNSATYTFSMWVKTNASTQPFSLRIDWNNGSNQTGTASSYTATTTWQRFSVTQAVSASGMVSVTPTLIMTNNSATIVGWGAQMVQASIAEVYVRSLGNQMTAANGLTSNGTQFTNNGATLDNTLALSNFSSGGSIGAASATVDIYTSISVAQTTTGQTLTIPSPTANNNYGRVLYLSNIGTASFIVSSTNINAGQAATLVWSHTNGGDSWVYAGAGADSILNQNSFTQTANFQISGTGQANTSLLTPLVDVASAGTLSLGTGTATGVTIGGTTNTTAIALQGAAASTYTIGNTNTTGTITIGQSNSSNSNTISVGSNIGASGTQTINIGTSSTASSTTNVTVGSTIAGTTALQAANIKQSLSGGSDTIQSITTNSTTAFQIENAEGDPLIGIDTTAINSLIANQGFEVNATGWTTYNSATSAARDTTGGTLPKAAYSGVGALKVVTGSGNTNQGTQYALGAALTTSTTYYLSFEALLNSGSFTDIAAAYSYDGTIAHEVACATYNTQTIVTGGWTRITCQIATSATTGNSSANLVIRDTAAAVHTFWIDDVQLQLTQNTPFHGGINQPLVLQNASDSTTALQVANNAGLNVLTVDTLNGILQVGSSVSNSNTLVFALNNNNGNATPTEVDGGMYYNNSTSQFECGENGFWVSCGVPPRDHSFDLYDEFMNGAACANTNACPGIGGLNWLNTLIGSPGSLSYLYNQSAGNAPAADVNRPGILDIEQTGTGNGTGQTMNLGTASMKLGTSRLDYKTAVNITAPQSSVLVGLDNETSTTTAPTTGVYFKETSAGSWNYCYVNATPAETCTTTCSGTGGAITATAGSWFRLEIQLVSSSEVDFYVNGNKCAVTSITYNQTNNVSPSYTSYKNTGTPTTQDVYVDYFELLGTTSTAR